MADGIEFAVLGAVTATRGGRPIGLDQQQRALLAALLVAYPHSVDIERLRAQVRKPTAVPGDGGTDGHDTFEKTLADLGARLTASGAGNGGGNGSVLVHEGTRYRLAVPRDAVDAARFVDEVRRGDALLTRVPDMAAEAYRQGLRLWQGLAYSGIPTTAFAETAYLEAEVARLTSLRYAARVALAQAQLESGEPASAAVEAEALAADHPLDERAWELMALGLYRSGQHAHALAAIRRCRALLDDRLGCEIGVPLRRIETAIRARDSDYLESAEMSPPPTRQRTNVWLPHTALVDREDELAEVGGLLDEQRVVTLVGPPGVGRTRLAVEVSRRRREHDGPWIVDLNTVDDGALIPSTIATLLALPGVGSAAHLAEVLVPRSCVLVLDNCERVADYTADVVRAVVDKCPNIRVVVTGGEPLGLPGEAVRTVAPLSGDAAVALFAARVGGGVPNWELTSGNRRRVEAICREVGGLPLGIELAAAQVRFESERKVAESLAAQFSRLYGSPESTAVPQRRLRDVVDWVYRRLSVEEARLLRRIAAFAGVFDVEGATAMSMRGTATEVSAVLASLVRQGMVRVVPGTVPPRYGIPPGIRQFARDQADDAESIAIAAAYRGYILTRVENMVAGLRSARAAHILALLAEDQAEHRAALASAFEVDEAHYALELAGALAWFWYRTGNVGEGLQFLRTALDLVAGDWRPPEPRVMARALDGLASLTYLTGDAVTADDAVRRAAQLWSSIGEPGEVALDEAWRAHFVAMQGQSVRAVDMARHAVQAAVEHRAGWVEAEARMVLGMLLRSTGATAEAREELREAIRVAERVGHRWAVTSSTWALMKAAADAGDVEGALSTMRVLRADLDDEDDVISWLVMIHSTAAVLASAGRPTDGAVLMGAVNALGAQRGFLPAWIDAVDGPIEAATVHGALDDDEFEKYASAGAHLTREQVNKLVGELAEGPAGESG